MALLNWGMISGGGTFESLMHALVYAEDSTAILFGRPGKDSGQDARSKDGVTVYQAKYYTAMDMACAVKVALAELEKIKKYKDPKHANFEHWKNAARWVLVANIQKNPNDTSKWGEVENAFKGEGFTDATYWGIEELEQLLYKHSEVRSVFFEGENRVFWGLHESYDWLAETCLGKSFVDVDLVGRSVAMGRTVAFAEGDRRILPVVGRHGSGVSRFLYEVQVELSKQGWRAYWADAASMAASTKWFELLNGNGRSCLIVNDLDDPRLTQRILAQLNSPERANWKVVLGCHLESADSVLRPLATTSFADERLEITPLSKSEVGTLAWKCVETLPASIRAVDLFVLTEGLPGWLCLLLETCCKYPRIVVTEQFPAIVSKVIESCKLTLRSEIRSDAQRVLRWLSAWERLQMGARGTKTAEFDFLRKYAKVENDVGEVLDELVKCGLVRNWGVDARCYAVEPAIFRQEILRDWLLTTADGKTYVVSREGRRFVDDMAIGAIYNAGAVLRTLSNMAVSYLSADCATTFLSPIFDTFSVVAKEQRTLVQYTIVDLLENVGWAEPDRALEILKAVRQNAKEDCKITNRNFGSMVISHADVMCKGGSGLFQYARCVKGFSTAKRYLIEILDWCAAEDRGVFKSEWGNTCVSNLQKLMLDREVGHYYQQVAYDIVTKRLPDVANNKCLWTLVVSLMNPRRESVNASHYNFTFSWGYIQPGGVQWNRCVALRDMLFAGLECVETSENVRLSYWRLLSGSHQAFSFAVGQGKMSPEFLQEYRKYIENELQSVLKVGRDRGSISLAEFTTAREMWSWYLEYGDKQYHPVDLARQCEAIPHENSDWQFESLFKFCSRLQAQPVIDRVARRLEHAENIDVWHEFFSLSKGYLTAARDNKSDLADGIRVRELADCVASHSLNFEPECMTAIYVKSVLKGERKDWLERIFALQWCKDMYYSGKKADPNKALVEVLDWILEVAIEPKSVLLETFGEVDPYVLGKLNNFELEVVMDEKWGFSPRELALILSPFVAVDCERVLARLKCVWDSIGDIAELSACVICFAKALWLVVLRYDLGPENIPMSWILRQIMDRKLDGNVFCHYEMQELAKRSGVRWGMKDFGTFVKTRLEIEDNGRPYEEFREFPFEFNAADWCVIDDQSEFNSMCELALSRRSFVTLYELPKCLAQLDPHAEYLAEFIENHLLVVGETSADYLYHVASLVAMCRHESSGWLRVLGIVCRCCENFDPKDRYRVYAGLQPKMRTGSWRVGTVPKEVVDAAEDARKLFAAEPKDSPVWDYREWVLRCAEEELRIAEARAEEERHDGA